MIGDIAFPVQSLSEMTLVRDRYTEYIRKNDIQPLHIENPGISSTILVSVLDFISRFSGIQTRVVLPRILPVRDIIDKDIIQWMKGLDKNGLIDLYNASYILGYTALLDITSLVLSEDIDCKSL